jgi:hypothetical protein
VRGPEINHLISETIDPRRSVPQKTAADAMAETDGSSRPSFSGFWKKSKETLGVGKIRFVESTPAQGAGAGGE